MRTHLVIDFMFLYYKYLNTQKIGRLKSLTAKNCETGEMIDITLVYYPIREIEALRKKHEANGEEVTVSICFDSPSKRGDEDSDYKKTRKKTLDTTDFDNISLIRSLLEQAGHNVYKVDGEEADDLVYTLVSDNKDSFDKTVVYTTDYDLLINVQPKVEYRKYKAGHGFEDSVTERNFAEYMVSHKMSDTLQNNGILLYKCILGDKSDNIAGVKGIGKAKFDALIRNCIGSGLLGTEPTQSKITWKELREPNKVSELLIEMANARILNSTQLEQAQYALKLVTPHKINSLSSPEKVTTYEARNKAYGLYGMTSLIE